MSQHRAKRPKTKAPTAALPPSYEELAALHVATLTAVAFLAPKGVLCSLPVLQQSVAALTTHALGVEQLQMMVALDASLGLRHAWIAPAPGAQPEEVLELVLREPLKVACSPGAVRSRARRFRTLLEAAAASDPPVELPLAPLPPPAPAAHGVGAGEAEDGGGGFSCAAEQAHHHEEAADATRPSPTAIGEVTGLPSPPPKPLRRVSCASGRAAMASGVGGVGTVGAPVSGAQSAASAAPELSSTTEGEVEAAAAAEATAVEAEAAAAAEAAAEAEAAAGRSGCAAFLQRVRETPFYRGQIVHTHVTPAAPPRYMPLSCALAPAVGAALRASGVEQLYSHQAAAIDALFTMHVPCIYHAYASPCIHHAYTMHMHTPCICLYHAQAAAIDALLAGRDAVMLATPTASGKSLAYNVPCLHAIATDTAARAIYIFPTKALAQDQLRALRALCNAGAPSLGNVPSSWCRPLPCGAHCRGAGLRAWAALRASE